LATPAPTASAKNHPAFANLERPFKAPKGWKKVALIFGLFTLPLCLVGVVYLNSLEVGWTSTGIGFLVLSLYIPIWLDTQRESRRLNDKATAAPSSDEDAGDLERVPNTR
jgi:uncharacterized membrane protein YfcA